ncbi:MAG: CHASE3 domain-containing protein [Xanthobacteraceae bacterium]|nr:CHASE3 domain-containing protein [Xanthobacteraceae bacterium]QYK43742.1 MAG: CHASE3 domain-containing protein [Xanthobacteraceae bacterium]
MPYKSLNLPAPRRGIQSVLLGLGFALLVLVVGAFAWLAKQQADDNADVRRVLEMQARFTKALSLLQDAETGQRGYLLTGNPDYLKPYEGTAAAFDEELTLIAKLIKRQERAVQLAGIRSLAEKKFSELQTTIDLFKKGEREAALALVQTDLGKRLMDDVREMINQMHAFDDRILKERLAETDETTRKLWWGVLASVLLVLVMIFAVFTIMSRYIRELVSETAKRASAETRIRQMQKMEAVGQLTGGIAHDFNNMLAIVIGSLSLMQKRLARGDTDVSKYSDAAMEGAQRAATLTSRLLAFSRQQPLQPATLDLNKLVAGMSELLRRTIGENVQMETVLAGGLWRTHADPGEVENAILNLCVNARDAMPGGGKLTIETANCYLDEAYSSEHPGVPAGQYVLIAVSDTGSGMSTDIANRAFDPFFTTKPTGKGTGLGLSQVYGFVKQTGGHVKIYSEVDHGTTIKIYLPRTQRAEDIVSTQPKPALPTGDPTVIILVVEDEDRVRLVSVAALRELGYTVLHADSGPSALEVLKKNPGVNLLFTDIVMPGMNGRALATEAEKLNPGMRILYTTGYTHNAVVHNGVVDSDAQLIVKPYTIDQLALKVREVLAGESRRS